MADKRQRALKALTASGQAAINQIARSNQRLISGVVSEFVNKRTFATNAALRKALYKELASEYKKFGGQIDTWMKKSVTDTARAFWGFAKADLGLTGTFGAFSAKHVQDILGQINPTTVNRLVGINAQAGNMYGTHLRRLRSAVSTSIAEGSVEGLTNKALADRMKLKVLKETSKFQFIDAAGKRWNTDAYFGMLNRTLHADAARKSYAAAGTDAGFDLYLIAGGVTGSSAENPGDPCDEWAGRVFSMTGNTDGYPTYADAVSDGVFHPNCVHFVRALTQSEADRAEADMKEAS